MDGENASRLVKALERGKHEAVVVINCMPELMRHTRMGRLDVKKLGGVAGWLHKSTKADKRKANHGQYLKLFDRLPRHSQVCADGRCAYRRETLPLSLLLLPSTDAGEHSVDVALLIGALRRESAS